AASRALRRDVIENAVIAGAELVYACRRENVRLSDSHVARVIDDALIAAEGIRLRKSSGGASGHIRDRLVIAEASESRIRAGEVVIQPHVKLRLVQLAHRFSYE